MLFRSESLAKHWESRGDLRKAVEVLERTSGEKTRALFAFHVGPGLLFWMRDQMQLAQLYRKVGQHQDAQKIEDELRKMLVYADPDHPILVALKKLEMKQTAQTSR